jgi:hypothetical protein
MHRSVRPIPEIERVLVLEDRHLDVLKGSDVPLLYMLAAERMRRSSHFQCDGKSESNS